MVLRRVVPTGFDEYRVIPDNPSRETSIIIWTLDSRFKLSCRDGLRFSWS